MEVHHHPHLPHGKKKFKDYFLEFLTLFVAVTMGFFAENIRDTQVEKHREREYIESMVKELKSDSVQMREVFQDTLRVSKLDSLSVLLLSNDRSSSTVRKIYNLRYKYARNFNAMIFNKNTLTQLKNSGNMRLIRKQNVVDSLNLLDNKIAIIEDQKNAWIKIMMDNYQDAISIFDESYLVKNGKIIRWSERDTSQDTNIKLLSNDKKSLNRYGAEIGMQARISQNYFIMLQDIYDYQNRLIPFLEKEYDLEK